ncbi:hypothetical protein ACTHGU_14805 [Chitinophagaceae bacterium MMS25-I14]
MKRTSAIAGAILCIFLFATLSCKKNDSSGSSGSGGCQNNGYIKFLKVGNKWNYNYLDFFSADTSMTMEITSEPSSGVFVTTLTGGGYVVSATGNKRYTQECNDWMLVNPAIAPTAADKTYKLNRQLNDTWTTIPGNITTITNSYTVIGKNVPVTVPAGTFTCDVFAYNQQGTFNTDTIYFSNEVGYIKYVGFLYEYELKSKNF